MKSESRTYDSESRKVGRYKYPDTHHFAQLTVSPLTIMSVSKDRAVIIGIWNRPPNLTKEAFETKITSLVDSALALPIVQRNYLKFEIVGDSVFVL